MHSPFAREILAIVSAKRLKPVCDQSMTKPTGVWELVRHGVFGGRGPLPTVVACTIAATALSAGLCYGSYWLFDLPYWGQPFPMILPVLAPAVVAPWFIHFLTRANIRLRATQAALQAREAQLMREIEERKAAEARALAEHQRVQIERERAEEASRAKSRFLSNVSHELRTPLNAIIGFSELLHTEILEDSVKAEYAGHVHDASRHLLALINDVLDLARIEAGKADLLIEDLEVAPAAKRAAAMVAQLARNRQVELRIELPSSALKLRADQRVLVQMLLNLLSNAVKYTPAGGSVTVTGRSMADGGVAIAVADTGRGMSADQVERMLLPFERGDDLDGEAGGTGLGLSLVKSLMEMHGGRLLIQSELGRGTCATLAFPASSAE